MLEKFSGFDWDDGNRAKCEKHGVSIAEIENLFERPVLVLPDETHSRAEERVRAIARTDAGRYVFMVFTLRELSGEFLIRPISARYMHSKEVRDLEKDHPEFRDR